MNDEVVKLLLLSNLPPGKSPEETALWMIDWCREHYRVPGFSFIPKLTLRDDGGVTAVAYFPTRKSLEYTHSFNDAFEILNHCVPDDLELSGKRYIYRAKGKHDGKYRPASVYHLVGTGGYSACGAVKAGEIGYKTIYRKTPVLRSQQCNHCSRGTVIRQEEATSGSE